MPRKKRSNCRVVPDTDLAGYSAKNNFHFNVGKKILKDFLLHFLLFFLPILPLFFKIFSFFRLNKKVSILKISTIFCILLPDIRQMKPDIRPDTKKAGYPVGTTLNNCLCSKRKKKRNFNTGDKEFVVNKFYITPRTMNIPNNNL